ncbi:hypothetical protein [Blastococcus colisei]|uniref:hypothetical protein n=1 Tax=Blastococcus colisei TaxID=1564162 RepID=UPI001476D5B3|nr:hypothetical protein [Blastococcus colisei]
MELRPQWTVQLETLCHHGMDLSGRPQQGAGRLDDNGDRFPRFDRDVLDAHTR